MKIAIYGRYPEKNCLPSGGVETVTVGLANALSEDDDNDVNIISFSQQTKAYDQEKINNLSIHRLKSTRFPQIGDIIFGPGKIRLLNLINSINPDIVHSHETHGLMLSRIKFPHVFTVHGFDHANVIAEKQKLKSVRSILWRAVEKFGLRRHRHIISISPYVNDVIEKDAKIAKIFNIDNPVDKKYFEIGNDGTTNDILCVGWINERKNTIGAVMAVKHAIEKGHSVRLKIAGKPQNQDYMDKVTRIISENNMEESVHFLGHISKEDLQKELKTAMCLLLPSLQENAPMAISEAMAVGVPVIASNRCGMPFMVEDGKSGFLVEPNNYNDIGDKISILASNKAICSQMGQRGHQIALNRFHPDTVAKMTVAVYKEVISAFPRN